MKPNKKPNIHKFEVDVSKIKPNCILCRKKITDEEFSFEDYYITFRGFTPDCIEGFICFECIKTKRAELKGASE